MLFDEKGIRFTPTHTAKSGRRYRYYVSQSVIERRHGAKAPRYPAHEIEILVQERLSRFLNSRKELLDAMLSEELEPLKSERFVSATHEFAAKQDKSPAETREFFLNMVCRVVLHESRINVFVRKTALVKTILGDLPSKDQTYAASPRPTEALFSLIIDAKLQRCGSEMRLVVPMTYADEPVRKPVPSLVWAVMLSRDWFD
ncbi:MAG: hypothetical protein WCG81_13715 [Candidatus Angelobacter sp.]